MADKKIQIKTLSGDNAFPVTKLENITLTAGPGLQVSGNTIGCAIAVAGTTATAVLGAVKPNSTHFTVDANGFLTPKTATTSALGVAKFSSTYFTVSSGNVTPKTAARYNVTAADGKNVGNNLIDIDVMRPIRWIGLEPSVEVPGRKRKMTVYGFHSLRHSFASFCAEAGVPKATLLSILGTDSNIADKYYTHVSDESQRKAIEVISNRSSTSAQERNNQALSLIEKNRSTVDPAELLEQVYTILKGTNNG